MSDRNDISSDRTTEAQRQPPRVAVVLTGGGARGAYQVGVLRGMGKLFPDLRFRIITGVSAGAITSRVTATGWGASVASTAARSPVAAVTRPSKVSWCGRTRCSRRKAR